MTNLIDNYSIERSILGANQDLVKNAKASLQTRKAESSKLTDQQKYESWMKMDHKAQAALRLENVSLQIDANFIGLDFFQKMEFQPNEQFGFMLEDATPEIPINVVSQAGGSSTTVFSAGKTPTIFPFTLIESDKVETMRWDVNQGFTNVNDFINNRIAYSIMKKFNKMAFTALEAAIGNFDSNVWILDSEIKNAPKGNLLDLSSVCNGKITKDFYAAITQYFALINRSVRAVYAPALRKIDLYDWVSVSGTDVNAANTVPAAIQEQIWMNGSANGALMAPTVWTNTLEGDTANADVYAYAVADQAPGYFLQKPAFHVTDEKDEGAYHITQAMVTGTFVVPAYRRMNIVKIKIGNKVE